MTREMIITELQRRGYKAEAKTTVKNGVIFEGIMILTGSNISPVIYVDEIIRIGKEAGKSLDEIVDTIIEIFESNSSIQDFELNKLYDRSYVSEHLYIALQKESAEELIKRGCGFEGIESYLYIRGDSDKGESYSVKLNKHLLDKAGITLEEAWSFAEENTYAETTLQSMETVIKEMCGTEYLEDFEEMTPSSYVISNKVKVKGASAILNRNILSQIAKRCGVHKIVVLPSSVHEMILVPCTEEVSIEEFSAMVAEVNRLQVAPEERLTDRAYIISL